MLDIGELSERSGLAPSALRYYEEIGLIKSVARHGMRRQFDDVALMQVSLISLGKMGGFSLQDIGRIFGTNCLPELPRSELHARADALDDQIKGLTRLRDALRHIAECPHENHLDCPKFRRLVQFALRHGAKKSGPQPRRKSSA